MLLRSKKLWDELLTVLAGVYLLAFSYPAFVDPVSPSATRYLETTQWVVWFVFALDVAIGLWMAPNKRAYVKTHPLELLCVALPALRPLRLLRLITVGSLVVQRVAVGRQFAIMLKVLLFSALVAYIAAVQITITERGVADSNIRNFADGLWWAFTTVTTVGYGDRYPTTTEGRILAVALMMVGISLMGVITASVAAWFVQMSQGERQMDS